MDMYPKNTRPDSTDHVSNLEIESRKNEIIFLTELTMSALELADILELSPNEVIARQARIDVSPDLIMALPPKLFPKDITSLIDKDNLGITIEFLWQYLDERPSLRFSFTDKNHRSEPVLTIQREGVSSINKADFDGSFTNNQGGAHDIRINQDDLNALLEDFITNKNVIITESGSLNARLLKELIVDPQYPPTARYIQDTLIQKGCSHVLKDGYEIEVDEKKYAIEITTDNGKTTCVEIRDIFSDDIAIIDGQITRHERGIYVRIYAQNLQLNIQFFKLEDGTLVPYEADNGDRLRLYETINYLKNNLR
jgi:hypothetical protein